MRVRKRQSPFSGDDPPRVPGHARCVPDRVQKQRLAEFNDTIFPIGSIGKVYTATLVMALVEDGMLNLDVPIATYLPDLRLVRS